MNYFVVQIFFANRIDSSIITEREAVNRGYQDGYVASTANFDLFVDGFTTHDAAMKYSLETVGR